MGKRGFWLIGTTIIIYLSNNPLTKAQIIPDGTTPNTSITGNCLTQCNITGGIQAGNNLFHSFQEFNLRLGESLYFRDPGVANIFSRVTGNNLSQIFGTLGVAGGNANLFLLNPNGILFGAGAKLDVNGSFVATTADQIGFGDRYLSVFPDFNEDLTLLTVNPSAFFFNQMEKGNPITVAKGASLTVPKQQNILLLGANNSEQDGILIEEGLLQAPQGRVELGAVGQQGKIGLTPEFQLQFPSDLTTADISLTQASAINVSGVGAGSVHLEGGNINLTEGSTITANTLGNGASKNIVINAEQLQIKENAFIAAYVYGIGDGGNIIIKTQKSVNLVGAGAANYQYLVSKASQGSLSIQDKTGGLETATNNMGKAGDISVTTQNLNLRDGAVIATPTFNNGNGGNIDLNVADTIDLNTSGLFTIATIGSQAKAGDLSINTGKLNVADGALIATSTFGASDGGNVFINADESVELIRTPGNSFFPTGIYSNSLLGMGTGGDLIINTQSLAVEEGALISSSSGAITNQGLIPFGGDGGNIRINADESVNVAGISSNGLFRSSIISGTNSNYGAGDITIKTGKLTIAGEAFVSASALGSGNGGDVTIFASDSVNLKGLGVENLQRLILSGLSGQANLQDIGSGLFTITTSGQPGKIIINAPRLNLSEGAIFSTATLGSYKGGNIGIQASKQVDIAGSTINSSTLGIGEAGNIQINTARLTIHDGGLLATSTIGLGNAGDLLINATELVELNNTPAEFILSGGISTSNSSGLARAGNLTINTKNLFIQNGTTIEAVNNINSTLLSSNYVGKAANSTQKSNIIINASDSVYLSGYSSNDKFISSISSKTTTNSPASNIKLTTKKLVIDNRAEITVNSTGNGAAGNLDIQANSLKITNGGNLNATTFSGRGGNINLRIQDFLQLSDRSKITTDAQGLASGGNIEINSDFLIAFDGSSITANAISGQGGNIDILAQELFISPSSTISASSQLGIDGEVNIKTIIQDFNNNLVRLPEETIQAENQIVRGCNGRTNFAVGEFNYIGRGGLPPSPLEKVVDNFESNFLEDFGNFKEIKASFAQSQPQYFNKSTQSNSFSSQPIVEAQGWGINSQGKIVLTATVNHNESNYAFETANLCLFNPQ